MRGGKGFHCGCAGLRTTLNLLPTEKKAVLGFGLVYVWVWGEYKQIGALESSNGILGGGESTDKRRNEVEMSDGMVRGLGQDKL